MHFAIISPPVPGHIHPFGALGRELIARGHRVSFIHVPDLADRVQNEELEFIPIGASEYPRGSLHASLAELGRRKGLSALKFTIHEVARSTDIMLRHAPDAIKSAGISMILADQTEPAAASIAERLNLPFVTVCNALLLNREPSVPPPFTGWRYNPSFWAGIRNTMGYFASDRLTKPITEVVQSRRRAWGLPPHRTPEDSFSPLAQISQQPQLFDFPRQRLGASFHYVGPLRRPKALRPEFPWERLDGNPLIYASLGTLQNSRPDIFHLFAQACQETNAQLVIAHGGGLTEEQGRQLPGNTVAVSYAPQLDLLARSALTITHAGLNTVLDSLTFGVPLIAIPITYEQPAIARRIVFRSVGETIPFPRLTPHLLRNKIRRLLALDSPYRANAARMADAIRAAGGVAKAADIILSLK